MSRAFDDMARQVLTPRLYNCLVVTVVIWLQEIVSVTGQQQQAVMNV